MVTAAGALRGRLSRTYGRIGYLPADDSPRSRGCWLVGADPHVMGRLKRILPRAVQDRTGTLMFADTPELAYELEWVLDRWPLQFIDVPNGAAAAHAGRRLADQAERHRAMEQTAAQVLAGATLPLEMGEPARALRGYQRQAADLAIATGRLLVGDEVGLGKSATGAAVFGAAGALPGLVVCQTHLPRQWVREIAQVWPMLRCHVVAGTRPYDPARRRGSGGAHPDVLVVPYSRLAGWADHLAGQVRTVLFDEIQELRHHGTEKYRAAARIADGAAYKVGLSASPVYNYGGELYNIISVLAPDALGSREEFAREWGSVVTDRKVVVANPRALGSYLREQHLLLARTRAQVGREIPEPVLVEQDCDADEAVLDSVAGDAAEMARFLLSTAGTREQRFTTAGQFDLRMRQATGIAKAPFVAAFVRMLLETEQRVVLFGWHRAVYDLWREQLAEFNPVLYTGSESPAAKERAKDAFIAGDARVLIISLRSGTGLNGLQDVCSVAVFGELDWSPETHRQGVGRLWRDGQAGTVVAYFMVADHGSDPVIAEVLDLKRMQAEPVIRPDLAGFQPAPSAPDRIRLLAERVLHRRGGQLDLQQTG